MRTRSSILYVGSAMFSRPFSLLSKKTSFRLTVWYSSIFIASALVLFTMTYLLLSKSIRDKDRRVALAKIGQYTDTVQARGPGALMDELRREEASNLQAGFFVRLSDSQNRTLWETAPPGWTDLDLGQIEKTMFPGGEQWIVLGVERGDGLFEISSLLLSKDLFLQVGFGIKEREKLLRDFQKIFLLIMIPVVLLGVVGGFFVAHRALRPVKDLIQAIQSIDTGRLEARVPSSQSGDELDELVRLFNDMLARIEKLVDGMREALANVAQDLRTPMTRLRVGVERMLQADSDVDALREALMDCAEESERMVTILNTLMDISEAETGTMRLYLEEVNVASLIEEALDLYQYVAEDEDVRVSTVIPQALPAQVDANRIRQVMANLLDNAIKYTPAGGEISIEARRQGDEVRIEIRDSGDGIPPEDLPRIFDRLYRGDKSRSHRGLGLGLSLVRAIVQAHNGRIEVDSSPGQGSRFIVLLSAQP